MVEALMEAADEQGLVAFAPKLYLGGLVHVAPGPFADRLAQVEALPSLYRVRVLVQTTSQAVRMDIDAGDVKASDIRKPKRCHREVTGA
jgi:transcription antitermination factor NusG